MNKKEINKYKRFLEDTQQLESYNNWKNKKPKSKSITWKISKVKEKEYIQIWKGNKFICSAGSPELLLKKLVRLNELEGQTNPNGKIWTNLSNLEE